ncbi:MAG: HAD-IIA family hydrolase [Spirochaetales bacterium]|nr:HAD-IIA family hydrolase [Spirochaetales bacterium]MCF7938717.1 HAD-IIA family hydrolase [Spirochaetales bacterium]
MANIYSSKSNGKTNPVRSPLEATPEHFETLRAKKAFICDMDGVIYHGNRLLPGAGQFVDWLKRENKKFLFLTNSSERSPKELMQKLSRLGIEVGEENFYTSALATARFLAAQSPGCSVYAVGEAGLLNALYDWGLTMNDMSPDYVIIGETRSYSFEKIERAIRLVISGARLIGTNPDLTGPSEGGISPACGALTSPIELSTGKKAYYVGKPNPLMMRNALKRLESRREDTVIIGDRMDTDIIAGIEAEIETVLVLSGVTAMEDLHSFAYRPRLVLSGVSDIPPAEQESE